MATTPTQNSVPSESPRDLKFNAGKIDEFVTSLVNTYVDRFGNDHYTIEGLRWLAQQAIAQYGWIPVESFQAGATISLPNQILKDTSTGEYYRWDGALPKVVPAGSTPSSTGGTGVGAWLSVGDSALRSMLGANDGEKLVGECPTIAALRTIEPTYDKQRITLREHTAGTRLGGGQFRAVLSGSAYTDNNGTIIKTTGGAAWIRTNYITATPAMFGAIGDGVAIDRAAINAALAAESQVDGEGKTYLTSGGDITLPANKTFFNATIKEPAVNNTVMVRITGSNATISRVTFDGSTGLTSRGILINAGLSDINIYKCRGINLKKYLVGSLGDYTNNIYSKRIFIDKCYAVNCGSDATNFDRNTVLFDGVSSSAVRDCVFEQCNWGVSFRQPFTYPALTDPYAFYNKVTGCTISGKGYSGNPYPENQGISAQSQRHLEISGNTVEGFFGNAVDNQRCDFSRILNNRIGGSSDGIFFGDLLFRGHEVIGNIISSCVRGIRVYGVSSYLNQTMRGLTVTDNTFLDCTYYGIYVSNTESTVVFTTFNISNNVIESSGTRTLATFQQAVFIEGVVNSNVNDNVIQYSRLEGLRFNKCVGVNAIGNNVSFFDASNTTQAGIYIDVNSRGVMLRNSIVTSSSGAGPAVRETGTNNTVAGTRWNGVTSGVNATGTGVVLADNVAF
ncbi:right-handed parallel beta-helix repeat-containing protein [Enterobacter kobei]|uniref:tail fiber/spike domain-containing protein n=1 Tax=Enterobacter kobei TaxID=208224 RepID=UPI0038732787